MVDTNIINSLISALTDKFENKQTNKKDDITGDFTTDSVSYPTVKAVKSFITSVLSGKADSTHSHGDITSDGKVGSTSGKPLITGTGGKVAAGSFGTTSGTFVEGNDSRLSDARTPTSHAHGDITNDGKIGSTSGKPLITTTGGKIATGSFGSSAGTFVEGNDSRLSDARAPTSHTHTKSEISDFPSTMTPASHAHGDITNDGKVGSTANKPLITGTGGKVAAGSFGTSANTFCEGNDSRLSDARTPTAHNQASSTITDSNTYANIGNQNATQESINSAINTKLGALVSVDVFVIDTADANGKPSTAASASTMNKLYLIKATSDKEDNYNEFITIRSGSSGSYTYAWEKIGSTSIDLSGFVQASSLKAVATSGSYADLTNKPSYTPVVTSSTSGAYKIGSINISGSSVDIYGKDTDTHVSTSDIDSEIEAYLTAITTALNS